MDKLRSCLYASGVLKEVFKLLIVADARDASFYFDWGG